MKPADALWEKFDAEVACTYRTPDMVRILDAVDAARAASAEAHQQEIQRLQFQVKQLTSEWSVMALACGNWRDFGTALTPEAEQRRQLIADGEYQVAARAILEREDFRSQVQRLTEERDTLKATQLKFGTLQHEFMQRAETAEAERDAALKARDEAQAQLATLLAKWRAESAIGENGYYDERMDGIADCAKELAALLERPQ